jgi:hypothetical protein
VNLWKTFVSTCEKPKTTQICVVPFYVAKWHATLHFKRESVFVCVCVRVCVCVSERERVRERERERERERVLDLHVGGCQRQTVWVRKWVREREIVFVLIVVKKYLPSLLTSTPKSEAFPVEERWIKKERRKVVGSLEACAPIKSHSLRLMFGKICIRNSVENY